VDAPAARADRQWEELTDRSREAYRRARDLLEQGVPPNDIARQVGLGVAEVNVLKRMRDAGRR
jgi:DNA-binding CsgD family transcriptional regulator